MPHTRLINLNAAAGAFTDIFATIPCCFWEIMEDEAGAMQGLQIQTPADAFTETHVFSAGSEPIQYPNVHRYPQPPGGPLLGTAASNVPTGGVYNALTSYALGVTVLDSTGAAFISLSAANLGNAPHSSPTKWAAMRGYRPADKLLSAKSNGAATVLRVIEYE